MRHFHLFFMRALPAAMRRDLSYTLLNGTLPASLGALTSLTNLSATHMRLVDLRNKMLTHALLAVMRSDLTYIESLSGTIPASLGNLTRLKALCDPACGLRGPPGRARVNARAACLIVQKSVLQPWHRRHHPGFAGELDSSHLPVRSSKAAL
jgi:hypothetical protein